MKFLDLLWDLFGPKPPRCSCRRYCVGAQVVAVYKDPRCPGGCEGGPRVAYNSRQGIRPETKP